MDILDIISRERMAEAMGVTIRQTYKAQNADPERYKLIAYGVYASSVRLDELKLAIDTIIHIEKLQKINEIKATIGR